MKAPRRVPTCDEHGCPACEECFAFPKPVRKVRERKQIRRSPPPRRSRRPRKQRKTSRAAMGRQADKLFSLIVRARGKCAWHDCTAGSICSGPLQCAHGIGRAYRSVRWDENNAFALCAGAHVWTTHHPIEWYDFLEAVMGPEAYAALKRKALTPWDHDIEGVLVRLAARAVALQIEAPKK